MITITFSTEQLVGLIFAMFLFFVGGLATLALVKDYFSDDVDWFIWFIMTGMYTVGVAMVSAIIF